MGLIVRLFQQLVTAIGGAEQCEAPATPGNPVSSPIEVQTDFQNEAEELRVEAELEAAVGNHDRAHLLRFQARMFEDLAVSLERFNQGLSRAPAATR